jgi:hypothetical protein
MWYTIYHKFKSEWKEEVVNQFYQEILKKLIVPEGTLFGVFHADNEELINKYFHEYAKNENTWNVEIDTDQSWGFTKTARKKYDIAVLLTYLFDDYLSGTKWTSGDFDYNSQLYADEILAWFEISKEHIKANLWRYIGDELGQDMYSEDEINNVVDVVWLYCADKSLKKDYEDNREWTQEEIEQWIQDEDMEEISEQIKNWFTSGQTGNGNWRSLNYRE